MDQTQKKVLVVEDDVSLLNTIVDRLTQSNYKVFKAEDGEMAVSLMLDEKPDLILLDLLLPKLDGFKVLERLRHYPDAQIVAIKVLILSNLWSNKDILRAEALNVEGYFVKANTDLEEVFDKINQVLKGN